MAKRGGYPGMGGMNMNNMMKQVQKMQKQMEENQKQMVESQKELEEKEFTAAAGGGAVEITINGKKEVTKVTLKEEVVDPDDIEMLEETGFCSGIENYSAIMSGRKPGEPPFTLLDYFPDDYVLFVDESHVTLPQVRGMYNGDRMRKQTLVDYGFRLPSALDNRPLKFDEFEEKINQVIYVSATPGDYELSKVDNKVVEQIIRPTGLLDPIIDVRKSDGQIDDLIFEIKERIKKKWRLY